MLRYNATTDKWQKTGDMDTPRYEHGASAVDWDVTAPYCTTNAKPWTVVGVVLRPLHSPRAFPFFDGVVSKRCMALEWAMAQGLVNTSNATNNNNNKR